MPNKGGSQMRACSVTFGIIRCPMLAQNDERLTWAARPKLWSTPNSRQNSQVGTATKLRHQPD